MNRLTNHFAAMKLAKLHLAQAREDLARNNYPHAGSNLCHAIELVIVSMNNITSIAFNQKPKSRKGQRRK